MYERRAALALILAGAGAATVAPRAALAHTPVAGIEGLYVGLLHPVSTPSQLLALLSVGLVVGQSRPPRFPPCWIAFSLALLLGLLVGGLAGATGLEAQALLALAFVAGALAAAVPAGIFMATLSLAALCGFGIGILSMPDPGPLRATLITIGGSCIGAYMAILYISAIVGWLRARLDQPWAHVGFRVAGAWIAAVACLMFALSLTPGSGIS